MLRLAVLALLALLTAARAAVTVYPAPDGHPANQRFRVSVEGQTPHVYNAEVATEQPFKRYPLPQEHTTVGFAIFDLSSPATVKVTVRGEAPREVRIRPLSRGLQAELSGHTITIPIARPGNYVVELNHDVYDHLYLFINPPESRQVDPKDPKVLYFGPGLHQADRIDVKDDGRTIYLAGGAVVNGFIRAEGVNDLTIAGRGILCGTGQQRGSNPMRIGKCRNLLIEDVILVDSPSWTVRLEQCRDVVIRNLRELCYLQNTDGIDPVDCQNVDIENVFIRNYDDGVVVKTLAGGPGSHHIRTSGSTFITDHATALKCGFNETLGATISDIVFEDCDVLACRGRPMCVMLNGSSKIENVRFENIRVEESRVNPMGVKTGEEPRPAFAGCFVTTGNAYLSNFTPGCIRDVTFRNCVYTGGQNAAMPSILLSGLSEASSVAGVTFEQVVALGQPVASLEQPAMVVDKHVYNVNFVVDGRTTTANAHPAPLPDPKQPETPDLPELKPLISANGDVLFEAESGKLGRNLRLWSDDKQASSGWYLTSQPNSSSLGEPPNDRNQAAYAFSLPAAGRYRLEGLVSVVDDAANSCWIRLDTGPWVRWTDLLVGPDWHWAELHDGDQKNRVVEFDLTTGDHTLVFGTREWNLKLDQFRLKKQ